MKDESIRKKWDEELVNNEKYRPYFMSNEEIWMNNIDKTKLFMDKNKKRPSKRSEDEEEKYLGSWLTNQVGNYKKNNKIMTEENIRKTWLEFTTNPKYSMYF
jgi:hypothetical protein